MVEKKITADDIARRVFRVRTEDRTPPVLVGGTPAGTTAPRRDVGFRNPMTALGDLIRGGTDGAAARLGIGTDGQVLTVIAGRPTWRSGSTGISVRYRYDNALADADPGPGRLRFDTASPASATVLRVDLIDDDGNDLTAVIDAMQDAGGTYKGQLWLHGESVTDWLLCRLVAVNPATGYRNLAIEVIGSSAVNPFPPNSDVWIAFAPAGGSGGGGAAAATRDLLTNGDPTDPELIFADGDVIWIE